MLTKQNFENPVSNEKHVSSTPIKSFQRAWEWTFEILAGLLPVQRLHLPPLQLPEGNVGVSGELLMWDFQSKSVRFHRRRNFRMTRPTFDKL